MKLQINKDIMTNSDINLLSVYNTYYLACKKLLDKYLKDFDLQKLFDIYIGKNVLNKFRQDHGYKDGTYKKIWNGVEDNIIMNEILQNGINSVDEIYSKLEICYKNIK